jgi:hypothetical protein
MGGIDLKLADAELYETFSVLSWTIWTKTAAKPSFMACTSSE